VVRLLAPAGAARTGLAAQGLFLVGFGGDKFLV